MKLADAAKLTEVKCPKCGKPMQPPVKGSKKPRERRWLCEPCNRYFPPEK